MKKKFSYIFYKKQKNANITFEICNFFILFCKLYNSIFFFSRSSFQYKLEIVFYKRKEELGLYLSQVLRKCTNLYITLSHFNLI